VLSGSPDHAARAVLPWWTTLMARTQTDLIARALGMLGVIQVGNDPYPEDAELVKGYIAGKFEELARRQILYVQNFDAIDDEYFLPLAKIIANAVGPEFGQAFSQDTDDREEYRLRDINRGRATHPTVTGEFI
jgi:hypothetical protein